jgi:hypothetical protein
VADCRIELAVGDLAVLDAMPYLQPPRRGDGLLRRSSAIGQPHGIFCVLRSSNYAVFELTWF